MSFGKPPSKRLRRSTPCPYHDLAEVKRLLGVQDVVCSRRFAILQGGKARVIDDLKQSGVNKAFATVDRLNLHDIDYMSSLCHFITATIRRALDYPSSLVQVVLRDGTVLEGELHRDFCQPQPWEGRRIDLSKAYKQLPVSGESRKFSVLLVHHYQTQKPVYFVSRSLPFGACASVYSFNRISRGIWRIMSHGCKALGGVYFDDFPVVEPAALCTLASQSFEGLLKALGWVYANDPAKCKPFNEAFDVLGTQINVANLHGGTISIENKPGRIEKVREMVNQVRKDRAISKRQAQVIHGNMNFAMGFVLGQTLKVSARAFASLSSGSFVSNAAQLVSLCHWTEGVLSVLAPRRIDPAGTTQPVLIFTDAAYEAGVATWGMVILDPLTGVRSAMGGQIPMPLVERWRDLGSDQVITLAEAFAVLLGRISFRDVIKFRRVLFFVDNEGARFSLIKGTSGVLALLQIVQLFHACAEHDQVVHWVERVPSSSNIADLPKVNFVVAGCHFQMISCQDRGTECSVDAPLPSANATQHTMANYVDCHC